MDYFQGVVTEYLVADRGVFVNTELCITLDADEFLKGRHWYCDAAAVNFREKTLYLCEVTYSKSMAALSKRLQAWDANWSELVESIRRDCELPEDWSVQPWAFIPSERVQVLTNRMTQLGLPSNLDSGMPYPRITHLESVVPWKYDSWDRKVEALEGAEES